MRFKMKSLSFYGKHDPEPPHKPEIMMTKDVKRSNSWDCLEREKDIRQGIDLATTLERIEKNFVITDPWLLDNPIIFAADSFLELAEYSREEIPGRNCRFLQGPDTDLATVQKIRDAIRDQKDITIQLINYTKSGKKFWNLFHLQPMRDQKVKETAENVDEAVQQLPDADLVSLTTRQLIHGLLDRDPVNRIGSNGAANEIKQHPFFRGINWPLIRYMTPPPLEVPLQFIGKDPEVKTKNLQWEDEGMLNQTLEIF